jgi:glycosyltransferase involved in cell wall biosynthesis
MQHLKKLAASNVRLLGYQSDQDVADYLSRARGFVCATEEDFGIAIVEAQAAGCPVIAYRGGGAKETVLDGETGAFFAEQSVESIMDAVQRHERIRLKFRDFVLSSRVDTL